MKCGTARSSGSRVSMRNENSMSLNELSAQIHLNAVDHDFWDGDGEHFPEKVLLIHCELSEAVEAWRRDSKVYWKDLVSQKPEGWGVELIDALIRILDLLAGAAPDVDIDEMIAAKMMYNTTRSYKHGGR